MDLHATYRDGVLLLQPQGRINHLNAEAFEAALAARQAAQAGRLLIDLSQLEYISSAGLRILMLLSKQIVSAGGRLATAAPTPVVREILEISRFNLIFKIHPTVDAAIAAFAAVG
ncbi:MAG: STAS domain-containing protein [Stagnimonas sp.]|nr:STAS domain-containing protein [Stagnimonas sp.]